MKTIHLLSAFLLLCLFSCTKEVENVPICIGDKIQESKQGKNFIISIYEYELDGEIYYLLNQGGCSYDCVNVLVSSNCEEICGISGGLSGKGSYDCPSWAKEEDFKKTLIWESE